MASTFSHKRKFIHSAIIESSSEHFVNSISSNDSSNCASDICDLSDFVAMSEIIDLCLGLETDHIKLIKQGDLKPFTLLFFIDRQYFNTTTCSIIDHIIPLCGNYKTISTFIEHSKSNSHLPIGLVTQVLGSCLSSILLDYKLLLLDIERQFKQNGLTMQKLIFYLQGPAILFSYLDSQIITPIVKNNFSGCEIVKLLEGCKSRNSKIPELETIIDFILEACYCPIFDITTNWLTTGRLDDRFGDYFISEAKMLKKEDLSDDFNSNYWLEKFTIIDEYVPSLFKAHDLHSLILATGKYIFTLRECAGYLQFDQLPSFDFVYKSSDNHQIYISSVRKVYTFAYQKLSDLILKQNDLISNISMLKEIYFLQASDLFSSFFDNSKEELSHSRAPALLERLQSNFEEFFSPIDINYHTSRLHKFTLEFEEDTLSELLMKIIHISADDDSVSTAPLKQVSKTHIPLGYQLLNIYYEVSYPLSIVLSKKSITKYQMIFRQLLQIHVISRQLNRCTCPDLIPRMETLGHLPGPLKTVIASLFCLKAKMIYFVNSFLSYVQFEVIDYHWTLFMYLFSKNESTATQLLEVVMSSHSAFLDGCLKDLFLTNWKLFRILTKILSNCMLFVTLCTKISKEAIRVQKLSTCINGIHLDSIGVASTENAISTEGTISTMAKQLVKIDSNFIFHIHLLTTTLRHYSITDFDHRIGSLIFQLESGFHVDESSTPME